VATLQRQAERVAQQLDSKLTDPDRYIYLIDFDPLARDRREKTVSLHPRA
jgi:hypothetical protein